MGVGSASMAVRAAVAGSKGGQGRDRDRPMEHRVLPGSTQLPDCLAWTSGPACLEAHGCDHFQKSTGMRGSSRELGLIPRVLSLKRRLLAMLPNPRAQTHSKLAQGRMRTFNCEHRWSQTRTIESRTLRANTSRMQGLCMYSRAT